MWSSVAEVSGLRSTKSVSSILITFYRCKTNTNNPNFTNIQASAFVRFGLFVFVKKLLVLLLAAAARYRRYG